MQRKNSTPALTKAVVYAASHDAGNRHARQHGRDVWSEDDHAAAVAEFNRLVPTPEQWMELCDGHR